MVNLNQTIPILFLYIINRVNQTLHKSDQQISCINSLTKQFDSNYKTLLQYYQYSGKGINQFGNYHQCIANSSRNYYIANIAIKQKPTKLFMGICIHEQCSERDVGNFVRDLKLSFRFWNVFNPRNYNKQFSSEASIVVSLILLCLLLTIIFTIIYKIKGAEEMNSKWKIMSNFSLQKTTKIFLKSDQIKFFNGIRVIGSFIVFLFHFIYFQMDLNKNIVRLQDFWKPTLSRVMWDLPNFTVDTFFLMAGFMLGYLFLKSYYKDNGDTEIKYMPFFLYIIKRILRLLPVYILCMMIYWKLLPFLGNGPSYNFLHQRTARCQKYYWTDLLFIGNFYKYQCLAPSWYIDVDVQLYIVSIIILFVYVRFNNKIYCYLLKISLIITCLIYCYILITKKQYKGNTAVKQMLQGYYNQNFGILIYDSPWLRTGPYFLGLSLGIYYYQQKQNVKIKGDQFKLVALLKHRLLRIGMLILGAFILLFILFIPTSVMHGSIWTQTHHSCYLTFRHIIFQIGIILIIFPFLFGYKNFIRTFLEFQFFQHISKISYTIYMLHIVIIQRNLYNTASISRLSYHLLLPQIFSGFAIVCVISLILALIYQYPIGFTIEYFINYLKDKKKQSNQNENSYLLSVIICSLVLIIGNLYYGYINQDCTNAFIKYPEIKFTLSTWLIIDGYVLIVIITFLIICLQIKRINLQFFIICRNYLNILNILLVLFKLAWLIVAAFMFWGYLFRTKKCRLGFTVYMYIGLIIGFIWCVLMSILLKSIFSQKSQKQLQND